MVSGPSCRDVMAAIQWYAGPHSSFRLPGVSLRLLLVLALFSVAQPNEARAQQREQSQPGMEERVQALIPDLEPYVARGMNAFDVPGLAIGIVAGDRLVYAKGFGVRSKSGGRPVDTRTLFQIGSTTKAFLAATEAIMVDRGKLRWDDRVVDLDPEFQLKDPWVTREFRVFDLLAQRSSLPGFANDMLAMYDFDDAALIRSLRNVEPVSSFARPSPTPTSHISWRAASWRRPRADPLGIRCFSRTCSIPSA
jgi:CubicO group peptidase (beta-lactamase class C family)